MRKSIAALAALVAGCSLIPEYQRPVAPVPAQWPAEAKPAGARVPENLEWRDYFPDPHLQGLIAAALEHNRDLRLAVGRVEEARAQYGISRAERYPSVDGVAGRNASRTPEELAGGRPAVSNRYDVSVSLLSFELDFWGRVASLTEAARAAYLASEEASRAFRLSLIADVANAHLTLLEMEERSTLAAATVASREETRKLMAKRREVGIAAEVDYLAADGALAAARAELAALLRQRAAAANALTLLVGIATPGLPAPRPLAAQQILPDLAADLPSEVLVRRPDVLAAEERLLAANASIGAARAAFLPRITLTGAFGTASKALDGLFEGGSRAWSFQPTLRYPLFAMGLEANEDLAKARKVIAVAEYERTLQQAFREVADLLVARDQLATQLAAQENAARTQAERMKIAEARYGAGIGSYLEVLDAQRELFSAEQGVVQTRRAWLSAAAQLYKALGGGGASPEGGT